MYRKCVTEISVEHQKQFTESLLELMKKIPFEEITVTQLCQAAGLSRRIFYHLFSSKTGALHALVDRKLLDIGQLPGGTTHFFRYWKEQKDLLDVLSANGMASLLLERMIVSVLTEDYDILYRLERNGFPGSSSEVVIFALSGLMGLVYSWYHSGYRRPAEEMTTLARQLMQPYLQ